MVSPSSFAMPPVGRSTQMPAMKSLPSSASILQAQSNSAPTGSQPVPSVDVNQLMSMFMSVMTQMLQMMTSLLQGGQMGASADISVPNSSGSNRPGAGSENYSALNSSGPIPSGMALENTTSDPQQRKELDQSLAAIANDPDGAKLLAAVKEKGISIAVGSPGSDPNTLGSFDGNSITVRDPRNIKTLVHELVHASSNGDGNSKEEEGISDVVGSRVASRIADEQGLAPTSLGARTGTDQAIFQSKQQVAGYGNLDQSNAIRQTLRNLGISVSV